MQLNTRTTWGLGDSVADYSDLAEGIVFHWNGPAMGSYTKERVPTLVYSTWSYHTKTNGWADIAYNYSIDRFGGLWEGRGDYKRNAASGTSFANANYLAVEFLCGQGDPFTDAMKATAIELAEYYIKTGRKRYCLGHREVAGDTACPGPEILQFVADLRQYMLTYTPAPITTTPKDKREVPDLFAKDVNGTIWAYFPSGVIRQSTVPEYDYWTAKGVDVIVLDKDWTSYHNKNVLRIS